MSVWIKIDDDPDTPTLLGRVLEESMLKGNRAKFLTPPNQARVVLQRLRTCLSRSRERQKRKGKKVAQFTLHSESFPYTDLDGKRHDCLVMWVAKSERHMQLEMLDDLLERMA